MVAVKFAEDEKYEESLKTFDAAIHLAPQMPSLYNNRAQVEF